MLTTWLLALSTVQVETMTGPVLVSTARAQGGASEQHLPLKRKLSARGSVLGLGSPGQDGALSLEDRAVQKVVWESQGPAEDLLGGGAGGG